MQECESCGEPTDTTTAMIAANGTGLSVCEQCAATLERLQWEPLNPDTQAG